MEEVTITKLEVTCPSCPAQIEAILSNGTTVYARSRYCGFSVTFADESGVEIAHMSGNSNYKNDQYGHMTVENLQKMVEVYVAAFVW